MEKQNANVQDLKKRIYDRGFKLTTMPSVNRPEIQFSNKRPLQAKIYLTNQKV